MKRTLVPAPRNPSAERRARRPSLVLPIVDDELPARPTTRGECSSGPRPCPWVSCRHHLAIEITRAGSLQETFPGRELEELPETCSLDVAERSDREERGAYLSEVAALLNVTRERVRQIESKALGRPELCEALATAAGEPLPSMKSGRRTKGRIAVFIYRGERATLADFCRRRGIGRRTVDERLAHGWTLAEALETPVGGERK